MNLAFIILVAYVACRFLYRPVEMAALIRRKVELLHAIEHAACMHKLAVEITEYKRDVTTPFLLAYYASVINKLDADLAKHNAKVTRFTNPVLWLLAWPIR